MAPSLVAVGNPLLDMQVREESLLEKYGLKANDAVLAEGRQKEIYEDIRVNHPIEYTAGGAGQNCVRLAQYVLPEGSTAYFGSVGKDALAEQLREANRKEGLKEVYQEVEGVETGACAVVITGHHRSLCTNLAAAEKFQPSHLSTPAAKEVLDAAKFFYLEGFFLTHGLESAKIFTKEATSKDDKILAINLSAPFIPQFFAKQLDELLPDIDIVFGNESEAEAFSESHGFETKDIPTIAHKIAHLPKTRKSIPRLVVITQGPEHTVVSRGTHDTTTAQDTQDLKSPHQIFPVEKLEAKEIVDTNGAGDAFAAGFMAGQVLGKDVSTSIEIGHRLGRMCVKQSGPTLQWPKVNVLEGI